MKPETATPLIMGTLIAGAILSVGIRNAADARAEEASDRVPTNRSTSDLVVSTVAHAPRTRAVANPSEGEVFKQRLRAAFALKDYSERTRTMLNLTAQIGPEEWPSLIKTVEELGPLYPADAIFLSAWSEADPRAAMEWVRKNKLSQTTVIQQWMLHDPEGALKYMRQVYLGDRDPDGYQQMLYTFRAGLTALAKTDLPRLAQEIGSYQEKERRVLFETAAPALATLKPKVLRQWIATLTAADRGPLLLRIFYELKGMDEKYALARSFPEDVGPEHYGPIYQEWAVKDIAAAVKNVDQMEAGELRDAAVTGIVFGTFGTDHVEEGVSLVKRFPGLMTNSALSDMILSNSSRRPDLMAEIVPMINDPETRLYNYRLIYLEWQKKDPQAARKWLDESDAPEQVRREAEASPPPN